MIWSRSQISAAASIGVAVMITAVLCLALAATASHEAADGNAGAAPRKADRPDRIAAFATLRPRGGVRVLAGPTTDFAFRIAHVYVQVGDMVTAGQTLAELDVKLERAANLDVDAARVHEARVTLTFAERNLERKKKLFAAKSPAISEVDLEQAQEAMESARAQYETAEYRRAYDQVMLDEATIRAPSDGMILRVLCHAGEGVSPDKGLIELGDVTNMEAVAEVFETDARFVEPGQSAVFTSDTLAHPVRGRVLWRLPKVDKTTLYSANAAENIESRVVRVVISLDDDPDARQLSGVQGMATINIAGHP
jgi:HlyD family secretion protein